jgi:hypothetical protein
MARGYSLEQDLRSLINNPKYSDIEILCGDEKKLYGCRAILAARSEVFNGLLYNGMKESYVNQISFPDINSAGMEIILEYTYTGLIKEESLTKDNVFEAFHAADYFQLPGLQDFIIRTVKNTLSPELLSKVAEKMPLSEDNVLLNLLVEAVATIPLNTIEFGRFSIMGLQYLLSCTFEKDEKEELFATSEYEVFRYSAILAAKQVSDDAYKTLMERLPTLEQLEVSIQTETENKFITDRQKISEELEPLIKFIDFRLIRAQILADIIEPLEIIPTEIISSAYRHKALSNNSDSNEFRGIPPTFVWDKSVICESNLIIKDNGKVVEASMGCSLKSVRAKMMFEYKGIFEWDIIIEKLCEYAWVGVCALENFNYGRGGAQRNGWVLASDGYFWDSEDWKNYCPKFENGAIITVHLNMSERTCAFTVNGTKYSKVSGLPSQLYPVVSLNYPGRIRIQPHKKI